MSITHHTQQIKASGIIAILRGGFGVDEVLMIADALITHDVTVLEITLNSPAALTVLPELQRRFGDTALIGAGTVRDLDGWIRAVDAGAAFTVAPNLDPAVARYAVARDFLHMPGVATPSEAVNAAEVGCSMLKLFPAGALGGPAYLKAIRAPLNDIDFIPVGSVSTENLDDYLRAGAVAVGMGSSLIPSKEWSAEKIAALCRAARTVITEHRSGNS